MQAWRQTMMRLVRDENGNVLIMLGLFATVLFGVIFLGVQMGNSTVLQGRMQNASDAAALAGAVPQEANAAEREKIARRYFALNFPDGYLGTDTSGQEVLIEATDTQVKVNASHTRDESMMAVLSPDNTQMSVHGNSVVGNSSAPAKMDMVMVMDASGSMMYTDVGGPRIDGAHAAANFVIDQLLTERTGNRIAWVDYTAKCFWGDKYDHFFPNIINCKEFGSIYDPRIYSQSFKSSAALLKKRNDLYLKRVKKYFYSNEPEADKDDNYYQWYGTPGPDALDVAKNLLAGSVNSSQKAVIYMTDGASNLDGSTFYKLSSYGTDALQEPAPYIYNLTQQKCNSIKNSGALIFAVGFGNNICRSGKEIPMLKNCATKPDYYYCAKTTDELKAAFNDILVTVRQIRITK